MYNTSEPTWGKFGSETKTITIDSLCPHDSVLVCFDLYIIDTWDGNASNSHGPDLFTFKIKLSNSLNVISF